MASGALSRALGIRAGVASVRDNGLAPTLVSFNLKDDYDTYRNPLLVLTFSKAIVLGDGSFYLRENDGGWATAQTFTGATASHVGLGKGKMYVSGNQLFVRPAGFLSDPHTYGIRIANDIIYDLQGRAFAGVFDDNAFLFSPGNRYLIDSRAEFQGALVDANGEAGVRYEKGGDVSRIVVAAIWGQSNAVHPAAHDGGTVHPDGVGQIAFNAGTPSSPFVKDVPAAFPGLAHGGGLTSTNMGLDLSFSEAWLAANPDACLVFAPGGQGSTSIDSFLSGQALHDDLAARINAVLAVNPGWEYGFTIWHQGEQDVSEAADGPYVAADYDPKLDSLVRSFHAAVSKAGPTTPFIAGELVRSDAESSGFNQNLRKLKERVGYTATAALFDLGNTDGNHMSAASLRTAGTRYHTALQTVGADVTRPVRVSVSATGVVTVIFSEKIVPAAVAGSLFFLRRSTPAWVTHEQFDLVTGVGSNGGTCTIVGDRTVRLVPGVPLSSDITYALRYHNAAVRDVAGNTILGHFTDDVTFSPPAEPEEPEPASFATDAEVSAVFTDGWRITYDTPPAEFDFIGDPKYVAVRRQGFSGIETPIDSGGEKILITKRVRMDYPDQETLTADTAALARHIYAGDQIYSAAGVLGGFTNSSTLAAPLPIFGFLNHDLEVVDTTNHVIRLVVAHRHAKNGLPVAGVRLRMSDGTTTVDYDKATLTDHTLPNGVHIPVYEFTVDFSAFAPQTLVTADPIIYPWVGVKFQASVNGHPYPIQHGSVRKFWNNYDSGEERFYAYVGPAGNDGTGVASATAATAKASPFLTYGGAMAAIAAATTSGNVEEGVLRVLAGTMDLATSEATRGTPNHPILIEGDPDDPDPLTNCIVTQTVSDGTGSPPTARLPSKHKFKNLRVSASQTSGNMFNSLADTYAAGTSVFEDVQLSLDAGLPNYFGYRCGRRYYVNVNGDYVRQGRYFSNSRAHALEIIGGGMELDGPQIIYNAIGYNPTGAGKQGHIQAPIYDTALNPNMADSQGRFLGWLNVNKGSSTAALIQACAGAEPTGAMGTAVVECIAEGWGTHTGQGLTINSDGGGNDQDCQNVVVQNVTVVGGTSGSGRCNIGYAYEANPPSRKDISLQSVVLLARNHKGEVFIASNEANPSGAAFAKQNFELRYNVNCFGVACILGGSDGDSAAYGPDEWKGEFKGLYDLSGRASVPLDCDFANDNSDLGADTGFGDYTPGPDSELLTGAMPVSLAAYPFDQAGTARGATFVAGALQNPGAVVAAPDYTSTFPAAGSSEAPVTGPITVTFNQNIFFRPGGEVHLRAPLPLGPTVEWFSTTTGEGSLGGTMSISGMTLTIVPGQPRQYEQLYAVQITDDAIENASGVAFAGILNDAEFSFTTAADYPFVLGARPRNDGTIFNKYVKWNGGSNTTGDGTFENPYKTWLRAVSDLKVTGGTICLLDLSAETDASFSISAYRGLTPATPIKTYAYDGGVGGFTALDVISGFVQCGPADTIIGGDTEVYKLDFTAADSSPLFDNRYLAANVHEGDEQMRIARKQAVANPNNAHWFSDLALQGMTPQSIETVPNPAPGATNSFLSKIIDPVNLGGYSKDQVEAATLCFISEPNVYTQIDSGDFTFDPATSTITITNPAHEPNNGGIRFVLVNFPELNVGDFFILPLGGANYRLFLKPNNVANLAAGIKYAAREYNVNIWDAQDIHFYGLLFEGAGAGTTTTKAQALRMKGSAPYAQRCVVEDCTFERMAGHGKGIEAFAINGPDHDFRYITVADMNRGGGPSIGQGCDNLKIYFVDLHDVEKSVISGNVGSVNSGPIYLAFWKIRRAAVDPHANKWFFYGTGSGLVGFSGVLVWGFNTDETVSKYGTFQDGDGIVFAFSIISPNQGDGRAIVNQNGGSREGTSTLPNYFVNCHAPELDGDGGFNVSLGNNAGEGATPLPDHAINCIGGGFAWIDGEAYKGSHSDGNFYRVGNTNEFPRGRDYAFTEEELYTTKPELNPNGPAAAPGVPITTVLAELAVIFPDFEFWNRDVNFKTFDAANPPRGAEVLDGSYTPPEIVFTGTASASSTTNLSGFLNVNRPHGKIEWFADGSTTAVVEGTWDDRFAAADDAILEPLIVTAAGNQAINGNGALTPGNFYSLHARWIDAFGQVAFLTLPNAINTTPVANPLNRVRVPLGVWDNVGYKDNLNIQDGLGFLGAGCFQAPASGQANVWDHLNNTAFTMQSNNLYARLESTTGGAPNMFASDLPFTITAGQFYAVMIVGKMVEGNDIVELWINNTLVRSVTTTNYGDPSANRLWQMPHFLFNKDGLGTNNGLLDFIGGIIQFNVPEAADHVDFTDLFQDTGGGVWRPKWTGREVLGTRAGGAPVLVTAAFEEHGVAAAWNAKGWFNGNLVDVSP